MALEERLRAVERELAEHIATCKQRNKQVDEVIKDIKQLKVAAIVCGAIVSVGTIVTPIVTHLMGIFQK